jgi:hypothetical protein
LFDDASTIKCYWTPLTDTAVETLIQLCEHPAVRKEARLTQEGEGLLKAIAERLRTTLQGEPIETVTIPAADFRAAFKMRN